MYDFPSDLVYLGKKSGLADGTVSKDIVTWWRKVEDLSLISWTYVKVEGENWLHKVVFWPIHMQ